MVLALAVAALASVARADLTLVADGRPQAVIVTPNQPNAVVRYAAEELAWHLAKASGAKLAVVAEANLAGAPTNRIYLGDTQAAREAGIKTASRALETCVVRTG